jgi:hypothetical protein
MSHATHQVTHNKLHVTLFKSAFQLWLSSLKLASCPPPPASTGTPALLVKTSSFDDMVGPSSPYPDSVSLGAGSTEELVEDAAAAAAAAAATAADVLLPFEVLAGLQPDACVAITSNSRITAWAVDSWAAGDV